MPTLRGAIIGYGFIAEHGHSPGYLRQGPGASAFEIVAVADHVSERRARAQEHLPGVRVYEDYRSLLDREAAGLDFVDVALPPYVHATVARAAFDLGLHVLCEKPLATSSADARAMLEHAVRARRVLFPCHNYKHAPVIKAARQMLTAGLIGHVNLVTLHTFRSTHARGVREWRPHWRREKRFSGGGIAMDHGSHTFYLAFDWLGGYPTSITAKMTTLGNFDTEDNFTCAMTFPRGMATAHLTWTAGVRKVIYTIHGDRGAIRVEDDKVELALMERQPNDERQIWELKEQKIASAWMDASHAEWFRSMLVQFAHAIDHGEYVGREARDSLHCIDVITTAYASSNQRSLELALPVED